MIACAYPVLVCVLIFLLSYLYSKKVKNTSKYMKNVPSKTPIFPFGNVLDFIGGPTVFIQQLMKYLDEYGDTVLLHDGGFSWALCTIDYDLTKYLLSSSEHINKASQYRYLDGWLGEGLLTSTGSQWKSHRKVITPSFHFSILQEFIAVFDKVGDNLVKKLKNEPDKNNVEISKLVSLYALDVITEAAMGVKINALEHEDSAYIKNIKTMCNIVVARTFSPISNILYPLTWNYYKERKALKEIHAYVEHVIDQRIEEQNNANLNKIKVNDDGSGIKKRLAFLDMLLKSTINGEPLTRRELRDEVNTFMFEGHDTTSSAITFCLLMLATHPQVQKKVVKEQLEIFKGNLETARPSYSQLNKMKYLDLVIKETLRLYPSVPFFGRKLSTDLELNGTLYPKGLEVMLFPFAMQRKAKYFPQPEKFIPERFEDQADKLPFSYTPFSAGPRNCIGQKFAMLEMLSIVSKIIMHFEVGPAIPEHKIKLSAETILISKNGVRVSLKNRIL